MGEIKMIENAINKRNLRSLLILFDYFYKRGVIDAMEKTDIWNARDFVIRMRENHTFGTIDRDLSLGWRQWLVLLRYECSLHRWAAARKILGFIRSYNGYLATILPLTMAFYLKGVEDYCDHPNPVYKTLFLSKNFSQWKEKIKTRNALGMIEEVQLMTVEIGNEDNGLDNKDFITMSEVIYQSSLK